MILIEARRLGPTLRGPFLLLVTLFSFGVVRTNESLLPKRVSDDKLRVKLIAGTTGI